MEGLVIYGTELEELDDEKSGITNKRPVGIEEQVVKDERGRRRFHGAFTGGFSAGYFNTVGSREGWEPKQFRSSRDDRGERIECKPEDFMDQEDLSEFGIAARRVKPSAEVVGENSAEKHLLAWERSTQSSLETSLSVELQKIIRPTSDSVGIQLLKKMGWREGQGIGAKMSRRALEKQKVNEERIHGKEEKYNEDAVREADEMAPNFMFAPNDLNPFILKSYEGVHGLGYRGLQQTSVLSEKYGTMEATLKFREKGKGISGQAFGVGAFEDDDENIYTNYDFSQYDFAIDGRGTSSAVASCSSSDTTFVMASKRQPARQFYEPPRIPPNFRPVHTPIYPDISQMPNSLKQFGEKMNHLQRAKFLGEVDPKAVLELIHDRDREKLSALKKEDVMKNAFEEEPMKQARFKQYVNYLKRGLNFPKPTDLTTLEWEQELNDFQNILPPELRSLIPEVKMRQKPLARMSVASPIADVLKLKFTSASSSNSNKMKEMKNDERLAAVKLKMFGEKTRSSYDWYPAKQLTKRFNVPDPYPSSSFVGVPHLQKAIKTETLANLGADILAFGSTQQELAGAETPTKDSEEKEKTLVKEDRSQEATISDEKPSEEFLKAIFGDSDESDSDDEESEGSQVAAPTISPRSVIPANDTVTKENNKAETAQKVITVMDLPLDVVDDGKEFGPAPPPECILSLAADLKAISKSNKKGKKKHKHSKRKSKKEESERSRRDKHKKSHYHHGRRNRGQDSSSTIFID